MRSIDINTESYVCPFLGMEEDPETTFLFSSPGNFCHRLNPPKPISTGYQGSVCFDSQAFVLCPIYKKNWDGKLPEGFNQRDSSTAHAKNLTSRWLVILLIISLVFLGVSLYFFLVQ